MVACNPHYSDIFNILISRDDRYFSLVIRNDNCLSDLCDGKYYKRGSPSPPFSRPSSARN